VDGFALNDLMRRFQKLLDFLSLVLVSYGNVLKYVIIVK